MMNFEIVNSVAILSQTSIKRISFPFFLLGKILLVVCECVNFTSISPLGVVVYDKLLYQLTITSGVIRYSILLC